METTIACAGSNTEESSSQNDKLQTMRNSTDEHQHPTPSQKQHQSPPQQHPPPYSSAMLDAYTRLPSYDEALKDSGSEKHEQGRFTDDSEVEFQTLKSMLPDIHNVHSTAEVPPTTTEHAECKEQLQQNQPRSIKPSSKVFLEQYCKKVFVDVTPVYAATQKENSKFVCTVEIQGKVYEGEERDRKIQAEDSAAEKARKDLKIWYDE